jgi:hypothetical protein
MIVEHVLKEYLKHVETNPKSAFFDGTRAKFLTGIVTFEKIFRFFTPTFASARQVSSEFID